MQKVIRQWDGVAGISLILIVFLSAYSLELTYWTYNLNRVTVLALLGLAVGLSLGLSSFREKFSRLLSGLYGITLLFLQLVISLDNSPLWLDRVNSYSLRFNTSLDQLIRNIPLEDGILFLTLIGFFFCFVSMNLGFKLIRLKSSWISFSVIVFFYYLVQFYLPSTQRNYLFISIYSLFVIVHLGRLYYLSRKKGWDIKEIKSDKETSAYFTKLVLIFTVILIMVSQGIPLGIQKTFGNGAGVSNSQRTWEYSTSWGTLRNFFYPLRQQSGFGEGYLPEILALGNSRSLKDDVAFSVKVPEKFSYPNRYYWKGRVYDFYENGLWQSKDAEIQHFSLIEVKPFLPQTISVGLFSFIYKYPREIIFTPQIALRVKREADLIYFPINKEFQDIQSIVDNQLIHRDEQVDVWGGYYNPDWLLLLNSSEELPEWIYSKYLQLPPDFSERIISLAHDISLEKETRIEKALAITNYLRNTFRYKDFVDIPQGEDPIEWFLFEDREGFCNYFSTADVLMLRSIGIPARMVVGYAQGERISEDDEFLVRIKDSHSWVEAFFPESGWVILEPTPSQPGVILNRPEDIREDLGRIEKLTLEEAIQTQNPEMELFSEINAKYEISSDAIQHKTESKRNLIAWFTGFSLMVGLIYLIIYIIFLRKKPFLLPFTIEKRIIQKGKKEPIWLKNWANYERLPGYQKAYKNLQILSGILLFKVERNLTPNEYFDILSRNLSADGQTAKIFQDQYQELTYGTLKDQPVEVYFQCYILLIRLILRSWKEKRINEVKFWFRLMRTRL